jgi:hypothetical protein
MQRLLTRPTVPLGRQLALRVSGSWHNKPAIAPRLRRLARRRRVRNDIHAHGFTDARNLAPDAAVAENADALADAVRDFHALLLVPAVLFLCVVEGWVAVRVHEIHHYDPFGDLRAVDAVGGAQGDLGVSVDGVCRDVVCACRDELDEFGRGD